MSDLHVIERLSLLQPPEDFCGYALMLGMLRVIYALYDISILLKVSIHETPLLRRKLCVLGTREVRLNIGQTIG